MPLDQNIKRNSLTGEVAVQTGNGWEIFPSETHAAEAMLLAQASQQPEQSVLKTFKDFLTTEPEPGSPRDNLVARSIRSAGRFMLPDSPAELAAIAASGGASRIARPAVGFASRVLAPAAAGAGVAAATGGDPTLEGIKGLAGAGIPEAAGLALRGAGRLLGPAVFRGRLRAQGADDAKRFLAAAKKEAPLLPDLRSSDDLIRLVDPQVGEKALRRAFDKADAAAVNLMKELPTGVLQKAFPKLSPVLRKAIPSKQGGYSPAEIPGLVKMLKAASREVDEGALGFRFRQEVRLFEESYRNLLKRDPNVLRAYDEAVENFARGEKVINLLRKSGAIASDEKGAVLDSSKLGRYMVENAKDFSPLEFPTLWRMISRGGPIGARDVTEPFLRSERIGIPSVGPVPFISVGFPTVATRRLAGRNLPSVFAGGRAQGTADILGLRAASALGDPGRQ